MKVEELEQVRMEIKRIYENNKGIEKLALDNKKAFHRLVEFFPFYKKL